MTYNGVELGTEREARLRELETVADRCRACVLGSSRTQVVMMRGDGRPEVVFVGEAPGEEEDRQGLPFVGDAGTILNKMLLRYEVHNYAVVNLVKCRPTNNHWQHEYGEACRPILVSHLNLLAPVVVVLLGGKAREHWPPTEERLDFHPKVVVRVIHPAAMFYDGKMRELWERQWDYLASKLSRMGLSVTYPAPTLNHEVSS